MPEGHTLHRLAREMAELVGPEVSASSPQGRFDAERVDGRRLTGVEAYGKHLLIDVETGDTVHVHLGMRGKWLRFAPVTGAGLPQVRLRLAVAETLAWDLIAPSTCELLDADGRTRLVGGLGPDPLRPGSDADLAYALVTAHPGTVAAALMDQSRIAGVGNVFRAEVLHGMRMPPIRPARTVTREDFAELWGRLEAMMTQAVDDGRIVTVDVVGDRADVPEAESRRVYKRDFCTDCGTRVVIGVVDGRTTYTCPSCQPAWQA